MMERVLDVGGDELSGRSEKEHLHFLTVCHPTMPHGAGGRGGRGGGFPRAAPPATVAASADGDGKEGECPFP